MWKYDYERSTPLVTVTLSTHLAVATKMGVAVVRETILCSST